MNLTVDMMQTLRANGFRYEKYEHMCNIGMVYFYRGAEYTIGGSWNDGQLAPYDYTVAEAGIWLPDEDQLMSWLQIHEFDISISYSCKNAYFNATAKNENAVPVYEGSGPDFICCLYKLILRILRGQHENDLFCTVRY